MPGPVSERYKGPRNIRKEASPRGPLILSDDDKLALRANQLGNDLMQSWSCADCIKILGSAMVKVMRARDELVGGV